MQYWKNSEEPLTAFIKLFETCAYDPEIAGAFKTLNQIILYDYSQSAPNCKIWMDTRNNQFSYGTGDPPGLPDLIVSLSADDAHLAWLGSLNVIMAVMRGKIRVEGSTSGLLKLASKMKKIAGLYADVLLGLGMEDKIEKSH